MRIISRLAWRINLEVLACRLFSCLLLFLQLEANLPASTLFHLVNLLVDWTIVAQGVVRSLVGEGTTGAASTIVSNWRLRALLMPAGASPSKLLPLLLPTRRCRSDRVSRTLRLIAPLAVV